MYEISFTEKKQRVDKITGQLAKLVADKNLLFITHTSECKFYNDEQHKEYRIAVLENTLMTFFYIDDMFRMIHRAMFFLYLGLSRFVNIDANKQV